MEWLPTLIDRLIPGPIPPPGERFARDLERLLNTRPVGRVDRDGNLATSADDYGLPPITGELLDSPEQIAALCRLIEYQIARFEPRLASASVRSKGSSGGRIRLRIEARLSVPSPPAWAAYAVLWPDGHFVLDLQSEKDMLT